MQKIIFLSLMCFFISINANTIDVTNHQSDSLSKSEESFEQDFNDLIFFLKKQLNNIEDKTSKEYTLLKEHIHALTNKKQQNKSSKTFYKLDENSSNSLDSEAIHNKEQLEKLIEHKVNQSLLKHGIIKADKLMPKKDVKKDSSYEDLSNKTDAITQNAQKQSTSEIAESNSEAIAQYNQALTLFNKQEYKIAAASFGRIIKAYKNDEIAKKAFIHLAFCLDKLNKLEDAKKICEIAMHDEIDETHQNDCRLILLKFYKKNKDLANIKKTEEILKKSHLSSSQKQTLTEILK